MGMTKTEKVIKGLEGCQQGNYELCKACPYHELYPNICIIERNREALELLKAQEPIKPTVSVDTWICSKCGHALESQELIDDKENPQILVHEQYAFCPSCGKAVKWE